MPTSPPPPKKKKKRRYSYKYSKINNLLNILNRVKVISKMVLIKFCLIVIVKIIYVILNTLYKRY